jgi:SAM-dependent methyltransferase
LKARAQWQGMINIARFNWPFYAATMIALISSFVGLFLFFGLIPKLLCCVVFAIAAYFLIGSLGVSHFIYDRSDLYRWRWLDRALIGFNMREAIFCHCGFDEASVALRQKFAGVNWQVVDHFDANQMTEASIRRARALFPPAPGTLSSRYDAWPVAADSADAVFGLLAVHELRSEPERRAWFAEARRCLRNGGRLVLVEHVRDVANFLAFGPGFLHFHSLASWRRCWESAGFRSVDEFRLTPFVRIFVLTAP